MGVVGMVNGGLGAEDVCGATAWVENNG